MSKRYARSYRNSGMGIILVFIIALIFSKNLSFYKNQTPQKNRPSLPQRAVVTRVIDGDTIVIDNNDRVRYIGINTPETKHPKRAVEYFGKEASEFNKNLVMNKAIRLEYDAQRFDKYGRVLAYVYADDIFVNAKLVEEGYAQVFTMPPNVRHANLFLRLQKKAKAEKKGLWREFVDEIK